MPAIPPDGPPTTDNRPVVAGPKPPPGNADPAVVPARTRRPTEVLGRRGWLFLISAAFVTLAFVSPWMTTLRGAAADHLYSYVVLIPFVSAWLVWQRPRPAPNLGNANPAAGILLLTIAIACAIGGVLARRAGWITHGTSWLSTQLAAWVIAIWGAAAFHLGKDWLRDNLFAVCFLAFTIPLPDPAVNAIEFGLQSASAEASDWLFAASRTPYYRDGMFFLLPNLHIHVAPECSGIRSTLVLFITGVLGAHILLKRWYHRLAVVLVIVPLGVFRNALRILTLSLLSVHVDPGIMDSALHKRGGPLFFAVSLIPLFVMFWWFGRRERKDRRSH